ncbi:fructose-6-phosphate aldolase [Sulfurihydrogenibium azorense]|jgi:transaldolase|uniref:Probable transaldolase n=1 Tax=Sulfurihydrogenibium azorense (strain DSM 15241 / OCM 825 / Az-Fu1) TaxID=204536 RepID=C1DUG6_SULAA|nr:fructose-6-phosphate aldolase [Sulfurihydrogenibium azorense]ACN98806.1 putative transaldolase [Sulfurihydrogenibium azorense Az-Fu1]MDM7272876.1 fructose-6-phosphate aldolase [Sulfurihydrogenibium azorense]
MKFFIDTADIEEIRKANSLGFLDGVTTNPTLIAKTKRPFMEVVKEILSEVPDKPVSLEVASTDYQGMVREGEKLAELGKNVVIKIPMTVEGLKAVKYFESKGIKTNVTLVFSPAQALLAMKLGASYISPFVGRLDDISHTGMDLIRQIKTIKENYCFKSEIIVASVRNPIHVLESAIIGADIATIPYNVISQLAKHPLTDIGLERFLKDWESVPEKPF